MMLLAFLAAAVLADEKCVDDPQGMLRQFGGCAGAMKLPGYSCDYDLHGFDENLPVGTLVKDALCPNHCGTCPKDTGDAGTRDVDTGGKCVDDPRGDLKDAGGCAGFVGMPMYSCDTDLHQFSTEQNPIPKGTIVKHSHCPVTCGTCPKDGGGDDKGEMDCMSEESNWCGDNCHKCVPCVDKDISECEIEGCDECQKCKKYYGCGGAEQPNEYVEVDMESLDHPLPGRGPTERQHEDFCEENGFNTKAMCHQFNCCQWDVDEEGEGSCYASIGALCKAPEKPKDGGGEGGDDDCVDDPDGHLDQYGGCEVYLKLPQYSCEYDLSEDTDQLPKGSLVKDYLCKKSCGNCPVKPTCVDDPEGHLEQYGGCAAYLQFPGRSCDYDLHADEASLPEGTLVKDVLCPKSCDNCPTGPAPELSEHPWDKGIQVCDPMKLGPLLFEYIKDPADLQTCIAVLGNPEETDNTFIHPTECMCLDYFPAEVIRDANCWMVNIALLSAWGECKGRGPIVDEIQTVDMCTDKAERKALTKLIKQRIPKEERKECTDLILTQDDEDRDYGDVCRCNKYFDHYDVTAANCWIQPFKMYGHFDDLMQGWFKCHWKELDDEDHMPARVNCKKVKSMDACELNAECTVKGKKCVPMSCKNAPTASTCRKLGCAATMGDGKLRRCKKKKDKKGKGGNKGGR